MRHATYINPKVGKSPQSNQVASDHTSRGRDRRADDDDEASGHHYSDDKVETNGRRKKDGGEVEGGGGRVGDGGLMWALISTIREKAHPGRATQGAALRRSTVAALGELLFYVVTQEPHMPSVSRASARVGGVERGSGVEQNQHEAWSIPVVEVGETLETCLRDVEIQGVRHYAAKTLENVLAQAGPSHPLVQVLVTPELALGLLDLIR